MRTNQILPTAGLDNEMFYSIATGGFLSTLASVMKLKAAAAPL